jgi:hypothetical protein
MPTPRDLSVTGKAEKIDSHDASPLGEACCVRKNSTGASALMGIGLR